MSFTVRLDVDTVIICPYDQNHRIARSRIQRHLVKCEKNYPPNYKQQCPYDATHRLFEHEMTEHVTTCPMKFSCSNINIDHGIRVTKTEPFTESEIDDDNENWDKTTELSNTTQRTEPEFESVNVKYSTFTSIRGKCLISKRYGSSLRRPFGYSESTMLDVDDQSIEDDAQSITSDMGIGRGQMLLENMYIDNRGCRRGLRGRILH